ncbi:MAG: SPOR domain-containing protein, partial [Steroidobacteraceae bacterium]
ASVKRRAPGVLPARPAAPARPRTLPARPGAAWSVQVGSFVSREHADRLARTLRTKGFRASVSRSVTRGRTWYRVSVGPERGRATALGLARRLQAQGLRGAIVRAP